MESKFEFLTGLFQRQGEEEEGDEDSSPLPSSSPSSSNMRLKNAHDGNHGYATNDKRRVSRGRSRIRVGILGSIVLYSFIGSCSGFLTNNENSVIQLKYDTFGNTKRTESNNHRNQISTPPTTSQQPYRSKFFLELANNNNNNNNNNQDKNETITSPQKKPKQKQQQQQPSQQEIVKRITQLEKLISQQTVEIRRLKEECTDLREAAATFSQVVELLRQAGLTTPPVIPPPKINTPTNSASNVIQTSTRKYETFDSSEIFGLAPTSVIDAADAAGASILAAMLSGHLRMYVDVRDAELSRDPDILVQFIELSILPVAAGLEGLDADRNRVKIVFPTVSQLLQYRKSMALSSPDVIALSTLGFDSIEPNRDNLVVIIAPEPDDESGNRHMMELINPKDQDKQLKIPVVVFNYHMVPMILDIQPVLSFEVVYHLRLLSVQYVTGDVAGMPPNAVVKDVETPEPPKKQIGKQINKGKGANKKKKHTKENIKKGEADVVPSSSSSQKTPSAAANTDEDAALEAAMEHAHEIGLHQGYTRAMVIRSYPRPWHIFVDTSPDADIDFEVAAIFTTEPTQDEINYSIVECLEGSEQEDELVAQQMQEALEAGQLSKVSEVMGAYDAKFNITGEEEDDEEDDDYGYYEDSC